MTRLTRCEMTSARFGPNAKCCTHISWTSEREGVMCAVWRDAVTLTVTPDACLRCPLSSELRQQREK